MGLLFDQRKYMFSEEEVSALMHSHQAKTQDSGSPMLRSRSATTSNLPTAPSKPHGSPLSRLSLKMKNRKSVELEPGFLRVSSAPHAPSVVNSNPNTNRRSSMEFSREVSFRYRAGSDAPAPNFATEEVETRPPEKKLVTITTSASFTTPPLELQLRNSTESIPFLGDPDDASSERIVYTDDTKKIVAAATIDQLIFLLAGYSAPDKDFISQFLRTHHRFVDSREFLQKYNLPAAKNISEDEYIKQKKIVQVRIINVIKKWIELQISDFQKDRQLVLMLQRFVNTLLNTGGTEAIWASNLQIALLQSEGEQTNPTVVVTCVESPPKPILPKNQIARLMQFLDVHPQELARQLTLMDSCALCKVHFDEYAHKRWCSSEKEKLAPNLLEIIDKFNKTSFWIASEIVRPTELRVRVKVLSKCIKLMRALLEMGNMQGVMAVYSALNITPIQRLHETWKVVPNKYSVILKTVGDLMSSTQNYKNYREHLRNAVRPFIPFQLIYLSDLTFISWAKAPDKLDKGQVNFKKMGLIGTLLNDIHSFQTVKHSFTPVHAIQEFITLGVNSALDEEQLYTISKTIEPRREV